MKKNNTPVLQDWVLGLDWKSQTALISSIRGLDSEDASTALTAKIITKMIRYAILNNADKKTGFMSSSAVKASEVKMMLAKLKVNASKHWYDHIIKAIELISTHNPNGYISSYWTSVLALDITKPYYSCTDIYEGNNDSKAENTITDFDGDRLSIAVLSKIKEAVYDVKNDMTELSNMIKPISIPFNCVADIEEFINLTKDRNDLSSYRDMLLLLQRYLNTIKHKTLTLAETLHLMTNHSLYRDKPDDSLLKDYVKIELTPSNRKGLSSDEFIALSHGKPLAHIRVYYYPYQTARVDDNEYTKGVYISELMPHDIVGYPMYEVYFKDNLATTYRVDSSKLNGSSSKI